MSEPSETRSAILTVAEQLFSRRGYESVGIQEVVDTAGITKPTLYYYFGSKDGLLQAIVSEKGKALTELVRHDAEYAHNLEINLTGLFKDILRFARENQDYFRLLVNLFASAPETAAYRTGGALKGALTALLEGLFNNASRDHGNMIGREKIYAVTFFALLENCGLLAINGETDFTDYVQYRIIHQYMHGIFS
jgi:TetR/AcrR family transcriptional regulator